MTLWALSKMKEVKVPGMPGLSAENKGVSDDLHLILKDRVPLDTKR